MKSPCILLVDDHAIVLDGLRLVVLSELPHARIKTAQSINKSFSIDTTPDIILLDIQLSGMSGLEGIEVLHKRWPQSKIIMLSAYNDPGFHQQAFALGAVGFISKDEPGHNIVKRIVDVLNETTPTQKPTQKQLTPPQSEVLKLLHMGLSNKLIAKQLNQPDNTIRQHVQDILSFFNVASRTEAVNAAQERGLLK